MVKGNNGNQVFMIVGARGNSKISHGCSVHNVQGLAELVLGFAGEVKKERLTGSQAEDKYIVMIDSGLNGGQCFMVVPMIDAAAVGYALCHKSYSLGQNNGRGFFYIMEEYVGKKNRRQGIYSAMLSIVLCEARGMGRTVVFKDIHMENGVAFIASKREGFEREYTHPSPAGLDYFLMRRSVR